MSRYHRIDRNRSSFLLVLVCLVVSTPAPLHAYLDPGTGSMLIQVTVGAIAAGLTLGKLYWSKISGLFKRQPRK